MDNDRQHYIFMYVYIHCFNGISKLDFEWFCFSLKYIGFEKNLYCLVVFLRIFCKLKEQLLRVWENFPHPRKFDHQFCPGIRQKNFPGGRDSLAQKNFPGVARGGGGDVPS